MLELRPIGGFIFGLNLCLLLWRISVQEPAMLEEEAAANGLVGGSGGGNSISFVGSKAEGYGQHSQDQQQNSYSSKHLLSENDNAANLTIFFKKLEADEGNDRVTTQKDLNRKYKYQIISSQLMEPKIKRKTLKNLTSTSTISTNSNSTNNSTTSASINKTLAISLTNLRQNVNTRKFTTSDRLSTVTDLSSASGHLLKQNIIPVLTPKPFTNGDLKDSLAYRFSLESEDYSQLIDLQGFRFMLNQPSCGAEVKALILIHSAPWNFEKRSLIRETWASKSFLQQKPFQVIFLLGSVNNSTLQDLILKEYQLHNDIVQGNFNDDYYNMTYKHVMAFKWFLYKCFKAELLIKVDDDVYVNTPQLYQYYQQKNETTAGTATTMTTTNTKGRNPNNSSRFQLSELLFHQANNLLFCQKAIGAKVKRTYRSKWRVSFKEYSKRFYPPYCPGYAIIYSADIVQLLYNAAQKHSFLWIDDVHITGILAQENNINITNSQDYVLFEDGCERLFSRKTDYNNVEFIFAWHRTTPQQIRQLWNLYLQQNSSNQSSHLQSPPSSASSASSVSALNKIKTQTNPATSLR